MQWPTRGRAISRVKTSHCGKASFLRRSRACRPQEEKGVIYACSPPPTPPRPRQHPLPRRPSHLLPLCARLRRPARLAPPHSAPVSSVDFARFSWCFKCLAHQNSSASHGRPLQTQPSEQQPPHHHDYGSRTGWRGSETFSWSLRPLPSLHCVPSVGGQRYVLRVQRAPNPAQTLPAPAPAPPESPTTLVRPPPPPRPARPAAFGSRELLATNPVTLPKWARGHRT